MSVQLNHLGRLASPLPPSDSGEIRLQEPERSSFAETLKNYVQDVAALERKADTYVDSLARGEAVEPHQVMMAVEEANLALDLLLEIRNKLLEAYQELARTPI